MIKIVIISHTFQKIEYYYRWQLLSKQFNDIDITLLAPIEWRWGDAKNLTFGNIEVRSGTIIEQNRFHIRLIDMGKKETFGDWTSKKLENEILDIKPDVVYLINYHTQLALIQVGWIRINNKLKCMKMIGFSWRNHNPSVQL